MKCVICHSPDIQKKRVEEEIKSNQDILLMPIEVLLCASCGERYYDKKTLKRIEEIRLKFKNRGLLVEEVGRVLKERAAWTAKDGLDWAVYPLRLCSAVICKTPPTDSRSSEIGLLISEVSVPKKSLSCIIVNQTNQIDKITKLSMIISSLGNYVPYHGP